MPKGRPGEETSKRSILRIKHLQPRAPVQISPTRNMVHERWSQVGGGKDEFWLRMMNWIPEGMSAWESLSDNWKCGIPSGAVEPWGSYPHRMNGLSLNAVNCQRWDATILTCLISDMLATSAVEITQVQDFPKDVWAVTITPIVSSNSNSKMLLIQTYGSDILSNMYARIDSNVSVLELSWWLKDSCLWISVRNSFQDSSRIPKSEDTQVSSIQCFSICLEPVHIPHVLSITSRPL